MVPVKRMTTLFQKTFLYVFFVFGVISFVTSAMAAYFLHDRLEEEFESKGKAIAMSIAETSQEVLLNRDAAVIQATIDHYMSIDGVAYIFVADSRTDIVAHTFVPTIPVGFEDYHRHGTDLIVQEVDVPTVGAVMDISSPILEGIAGHVHVGMDMGVLKSYFWKIFLKMQGVLLLVFIFSLLGLYLLVRRISQPLTELSEYAGRLARHDFSGEISIDSRDEVGLLARTMQAMAHELSTLFNEMNEEVAKATREVQESLGFQTAVMDNLADGLLVVDRQSRVTLLNPAMCDFYDLQEVEFRGVSAEHLFPQELVNLVVSVQSMSSGVVTAEIPLNNGRVGKALATRIWLDEEAGHSLGGVILIRDITHEKALDKLKTDFISTVSHELRTPMTSVLGFTKIIRKKLENDIFPALDTGNAEAAGAAGQVAENIDIIVSEAERLTELINDVLDIAKMESGKAQWRDKLFSMADVVGQSVKSVRGLCADRDVRVELDIEDDLPQVYGDKSRFVQVVVNLLSNAIKFMDEGVVTCRVRRDGATVLTSVSDQGSGIQPEELPLIFEKFKQVGDTLTEKPKGTGLGLPICKQIVIRHDGDIWVESVPGIGSTFYFTLPIASGFQEADPAILTTGSIPCEDEADALAREGSAMMVETRVDTAAPLILVVDDDPALGKYLRQIFTEEGFRVLVAPNGKEALTLARTHLPNLITMDLMMPEMDGRTCISCLRSNPFTRHIPILVVTALSDDDEPGADASLLKPVEEEHLLETANVLLRDYDVRRSCIVIGDRNSFAFDDELTVVCPNRITFCPPEDIWDHVHEGFRGFVFVPPQLAQEFDLESLSRYIGVQVLILPDVSEDYKSL